jgi:hypothetical protein
MRSDRSTGGRGALAAVLLLNLAAGPMLAVPAAAQADQGGAIRGVLYQQDGRGKLGGAKALAVDVKTGKQYSSGVTGDVGSYEITGLPAGTYDLAIDVGGDIYIADNLIELAPGQKLSLSYSVQPRRPANRSVRGLKEPKGAAGVVGIFKGTGMANAFAKQAGATFWQSPGGVVLLTVLGAGAAVAIYNAIDDDDKDASPSSP